MTRLAEELLFDLAYVGVHGAEMGVEVVHAVQHFDVHPSQPVKFVLAVDQMMMQVLEHVLGFEEAVADFLSMCDSSNLLVSTS